MAKAAGDGLKMRTLPTTLTTILLGMGSVCGLIPGTTGFNEKCSWKSVWEAMLWWKLRKLDGVSGHIKKDVFQTITRDEATNVFGGADVTRQTQNHWS
jgi:hypothetical protein